MLFFLLNVSLDICKVLLYGIKFTFLKMLCADRLHVNRNHIKVWVKSELKGRNKEIMAVQGTQSRRNKRGNQRETLSKEVMEMKKVEKCATVSLRREALRWPQP